MNQLQLLKTRRFWPLFATQFFGALNDNIYRFGLVIFITFTLSEVSGISAGSLVALSGGIFILPFFLFSALAGQLADKYEKSRLIRLIKLAEIIVMGMGAIGFYLKSASFLLIVLFLMGTHSAFFGPLKYGILPQLVGDDELTGGNGLIQMATYIAILGGAALGGVAASISGFGPLPVVLSVLGIALVGWRCSCLIPEAAPFDATLILDFGIFRATRTLLRDAVSSWEAATLMLAISWFWFLGASFLSLVPAFGKELLHADERTVTLLNAAFTVGIGLGSLACETLSRGRIELGLMPLAALGISLFALDVSFLEISSATTAVTMANFWSVPIAGRCFFDLVGIGACGAVYIVPLNAALQARSIPARRARVIGALNVLNALFMVASAGLIAGLLAVGMTIPRIFFFVAATNLVFLMAALWRMPEFRVRLRAVLRL
ncbi:MAG: MFS transporter [Gammaproteobacteria bacterium]|nr:MFS transporter [Gammaproteobacteria bacterium]